MKSKTFFVVSGLAFFVSIGGFLVLPFMFGMGAPRAADDWAAIEVEADAEAIEMSEELSDLTAYRDFEEDWGEEEAEAVTIRFEEEDSWPDRETLMRVSKDDDDAPEALPRIALTETVGTGGSGGMKTGAPIDFDEGWKRVEEEDDDKDDDEDDAVIVLVAQNDDSEEGPRINGVKQPTEDMQEDLQQIQVQQQAQQVQIQEQIQDVEDMSDALDEIKVALKLEKGIDLTDEELVIVQRMEQREEKRLQQEREQKELLERMDRDRKEHEEQEALERREEEREREQAQANANAARQSL